MSVSGVNTNNYAYLQYHQVQEAPGSRAATFDGGRSGRADADAAARLGLAEDDLDARIVAGEAVDDLAGAQGVAPAEIAAALRTGAPAEIAPRLVGETAGTRPEQGFGSSEFSSGVLSGDVAPWQERALGRLGSILDTDAASILASLRSGASFGGLLRDHQVDASSLTGLFDKGFLLDARA